MNEIALLVSIKINGECLRGVQINIIQLQLFQARLDGARNVFDVVVVDFSGNVQLLSRDTTLFDGCTKLSLGLVDCPSSVRLLYL